MQWTMGFRVAEGEDRETRAQEALQSNPDLDHPEVKRDVEIALKAAFGIAEDREMDDNKPYHIVLQGDTDTPVIWVTVSNRNV